MTSGYVGKRLQTAVWYMGKDGKRVSVRVESAFLDRNNAATIEIAPDEGWKENTIANALVVHLGFAGLELPRGLALVPAITDLCTNLQLEKLEMMEQRDAAIWKATEIERVLNHWLLQPVLWFIRYFNL